MRRPARLSGTWPGWRTIGAVLGAILGLWILVGAYHVLKPMPEGLAFAGPVVVLAADQVRLLTDLTYRGPDGERVIEQEIFDELFAAVDAARELIVLDVFFFNPHRGAGVEVYRPLSEELTRRLVARRRAVPELRVVLITDPINTAYGGDPSEQLERLRDAGVEVILTDLDHVRDSNPVYSAAWRVLARWAGNSPRGGWLPHPFDADAPRVTLRSWLRLLNFKANHRKLLVADDGAGGWMTIVTSANPHDASSAHSNVALRIEGAFAAQAVSAEAAVVRMSGGRPPALPNLTADGSSDALRARLVTESAAREAVLGMLDGTGHGDEVLVAMFYLAHRDVIGSLIAAAERGADVRVVLDPNTDAFGYTKPGIPNRQAAAELLRRSDGTIAVRWYDTHGEQFHTKLVAVRGPRVTTLLLGSANLTRRNLDDYNLEAGVELVMPRGCAVDRDLAAYVERIWTNDGGTMTVPYETYRDERLIMRAVARFQEATGLCTF